MPLQSLQRGFLIDYKKIIAVLCKFIKITKRKFSTFYANAGNFFQQHSYLQKKKMGMKKAKENKIPGWFTLLYYLALATCCALIIIALHTLTINR